MSKSIIVAVLIVFAVGFAFVACSQQPSTPTSEPEVSAEQPAEGSALKPMEDLEAIQEEAAEAVEEGAAAIQEEAAEAVEEGAEALEGAAEALKKEAESITAEGSDMKHMEGSESK